MISRWKEKYFHISRSNFYFGLATGIVACLLCMSHIYTNQTGLHFVVSALGVFMIALLCSNVFHFSIQKKVKYSFWLVFSASIKTGLGSYFHANFLSVFFMVVILMIGLAFSTLGGIGFFTVAMLTSNLFIIGTGFPANTVLESFHYSLSFFVGAGLILSILVATILLKQQKLDVKNMFRLPQFEPYTNSVFIYAFQLMSAVLLAFSIEFYLQTPDGYWLPMTALLILKKDHYDSLKRMKHRFLGTVIGTVVAIPLSFITDKYILSMLMIPLFLGVVLGAAKHYGSFVLFLTAMVSIMMNIASNKGIITLFYRNIDTAFGVLCVGMVLMMTQMFYYLDKRRKVKKSKKL